ncbi:hypothetical protein WMF11_10245 [Sorangium sp. So ce295]|uniref:LeuD/DmdB family oxidoreductase small subunit n=1 Tax=Sorangium sp. So ce295 TaxID=3133295 RepID=UPI003F5F8529
MSDTVYRVRRVSGEISTDDIIPARIKHIYTDPAQMAPHVFANRFPGFAATLAKNDALVCDATFGIGSSREQAVTSLKAQGVALVLAPAFGRIFFRNAWNLGLPAIVVDTARFSEGLMFGVRLEGGCFVAEGVELPRFAPPSELMLAMLRAGGLLPFVLARSEGAEPPVSPRGVTP